MLSSGGILNFRLFSSGHEKLLFLFLPIAMLLLVPAIPDGLLNNLTGDKKIIFVWFINLGLFNILHQAVSLFAVWNRSSGPYQISNKSKIKILLSHVIVFSVAYYGLGSLDTFILVSMLVSIRGLSHFYKQSYGLNVLFNLEAKDKIVVAIDEEPRLILNEKIIYKGFAFLTGLNFAAYALLKQYVNEVLLFTVCAMAICFLCYMFQLSRLSNRPLKVFKMLYSFRLILIFMGSINVFFSSLARIVHSFEFFWTYLKIQDGLKAGAIKKKTQMLFVGVILVFLFHVLFFWHPQFGLYKIYTQIQSPVEWPFYAKILSALYTALSISHVEVDEAMFSMAKPENKAFMNKYFLKKNS